MVYSMLYINTILKKNISILKYLYLDIVNKHILYNELSQKTRFQSVPIAALCLYNIQRENLAFKNYICTLHF